MRGRLLPAWQEPAAEIELGGSLGVRTQPDLAKRPSRFIEKLLNNGAADSVLPEVRADVEVANPSHHRRVHIGISIETAYSNQTTIGTRSEKAFAGVIEHVRAVPPVRYQPLNKAETALRSISSEQLDIGRQRTQPFDTDFTLHGCGPS